MSDVVAALSASRVNDLLQRAGRLAGGGRVVDVVPDGERTTVISMLRRFGVEYAGDAKGAPSHLLLKSVGEWFVDEARKEALFYRTIAPLSPPQVLVTCFEAIAPTAGTDGPTRVLLEDLSARRLSPRRRSATPASR